MLSARAIASLSDEVIYLYSQLESDIKKDMFRRLNRLQRITDATLWQAEIIKETSALKNDIYELLKEYEPKSRKMLETLFNDALEMAAKKDVEYYSYAKRSLTESQKQRLNTSVNRLLNAEVINKTFASQQEQLEKIYNSINRMTLTIADASEEAFLKACNSAYMKVTSGAFSWQSAYKTATNEQKKAAFADAALDLANDGVYIKMISYNNSGRRYSIEAATRMNILTGINQSASQQTLENCDVLGTSLVEVSAHIGARPFHEELQGRVYSRKPEGEYYTDGDGVEHYAPNFETTCHFGEPDGICGINCRHSFYPYFEGTSLRYSKGELDEMSENVKLDGKTVSIYEAEQELRNCERNIRHYKAEALSLEMTKHTDDPRYTTAREKIYEWQGRARDIVDETKLNRSYINEYIGTPTGKQPTGIKPKEK